MKDISDIIAIPLTLLVNQSLQSGIFPDKLKIAKVVPIFKSGKDNIDSYVHNYRPTGGSSGGVAVVATPPHNFQKQIVVIRVAVVRFSTCMASLVFRQHVETNVNATVFRYAYPNQIIVCSRPTIDVYRCQSGHHSFLPLLKRLEVFLVPELPIEQAGFRRGREREITLPTLE